jgi:sulfoxide reductase catalytic subunit YedY
MIIRKPNSLDGSSIPSSEITPKDKWMNRRSLLLGAAAVGATALGADRLTDWLSPARSVRAATKLNTVKSPLSTTGEELTSFNDITTYNNFYEFGTSKSDPSHNAGGLPTRPWTIKVSGLVKTPKTFDIDTLLKMHPLEDRTYRFRCVEGWSMVIPWVGYSLSELIKQCEPLSNAKYVQFFSYYDRKVEKWSGEANINWPYSEGLRMDEAMNPLTLLTLGLYGDVLPNQDGAPVRLIVPWKYGFKSAKSIVQIKFVDKQPPTTWNDLAPDYYGFYSNVNPNVDPWHSQKTERRIGQPFYAQIHSTLMFNGYGDQVASLYNGMDLRKYY